jgi:hypothetical protein
LSNTLASPSCRACGQDLSGGGAIVPAARPGSLRGPVIAPAVAPSTGGAVAPTGLIGPAARIGGWLGWKTIEGRVIGVEPTYLAHADFDWTRVLLKWFLWACLLIILAPILIGGLIGIFIFMTMFSFLFPKSGAQTSFLSGTFNQMVGFFFSKRLNKEPADVPVRDVRLQDASGVERLVRIKGEMVAGSVGVGDEISVMGVNRDGTLLFRQGWNKRINAKIKVKYR